MFPGKLPICEFDARLNTWNSWLAMPGTKILTQPSKSFVSAGPWREWIGPIVVPEIG
jgi:hypothetical protein